MPNQSPETAYTFGPFRYDRVQRLLFRGDELVPLVPKVVDTLEALLERRGQVVDKGDLMKIVWPDCVVEEVGLARNVSILRKTLGDGGETYIETIPRRGYRFAPAAYAPMTQPQAKAPPHRRRWATLIAGTVCLIALTGLVYWQFYLPSRYVPRAGRRALLAVVPIECLTRELDQRAFCEGFSGTLVVEISKLGAVQVISPSTVRRYRRLGIPTPVMARVLGLNVVVEGTAEKLGPNIRVNTRLTDVHSGRLIWADTHMLTEQALVETETVAARAIAAQIVRHLSM